MEQNAYIMESLAGVIGLVLGVRLYWRSGRSGPAPERFLGIALLISALGYALYDIPRSVVGLDGSIPPFFSYTSTITFNLGNLALAIFAKEVFRKRETWAGWLVVAIAFVALLGATGSAWAGDWEQIDPFDNLGYWPQTLANFVPASWLCIDGFACFFSARKRAALGLDDPLAGQRILLVALAGALWAGLEVVIAIQDFIYLHEGDWSLALGIVNGLLEVVPMALLWPAFFPPTAYRRWIEGATPA
jgi:hypothetical protein